MSIQNFSRRLLAYRFMGDEITAPSTLEDARLMPAMVKSGRAASLRRGVAHMVEAAAIATNTHGAVLVTRWECGGGSVNAVALGADQDETAATCHRCAWAAHLERGPVVYRCFDVTGRVVYIGSSINLRQRIGWHRTRTPWWPQVAEIRSEAHPTEAAARLAEARAIRDEQPPRNRDGVGRRESGALA